MCVTYATMKLQILHFASVSGDVHIPPWQAQSQQVCR